MIITLTDLESARLAAGRAMNEAQILKDLIDRHKTDPGRLRAAEGERYYKGDHDIKTHDFTTSTIYGEAEQLETFKNPNASDVRVPHKFLFNHIEQKVSYISGKEPSITVDGAKPNADGTGGNLEWQFQTALTDQTDARFRKVLLQWQRKASQHGVAWLHEYKDRDGKLRQVVIGRTEGIPIYDSLHEQDLIEFIRWYTIEVWTGTQNQTRIKAEWWTANDVTYWVQDGLGAFQLDPDAAINPAPHYWEVTYGTAEDGVTRIEKKRIPKIWPRLPFIELSNNADRLTDLEAYKELIDAYDLVASKGSNNLMDFNEFYSVVVGFGGDTAASISKKLLVNRSIGVKANGGSIEMKQLDLQMNGRIDWLKMLWDSIHTFGCAVDTTNDKLGSAASGVSLKFQYTLLDLKANNQIIEAELALKEHFRFIAEELNRQSNSQYDPERIHVSFNKSLITNDLEMVQMIVKSDGLVPERVLLAAHPLVDDIDQAYKDLLEQRKQRLAEQQAAFAKYGTVNEDEDEGDKDGAAE